MVDLFYIYIEGDLSILLYFGVFLTTMLVSLTYAVYLKSYLESLIFCFCVFYFLLLVVKGRKVWSLIKKTNLLSIVYVKPMGVMCKGENNET